VTKNSAQGLWSLVALGNMIGAGVFTTSGFALADLGSPLPSDPRQATAARLTGRPD